MRIRTLKPEFWSHPEVARQPDEIRLGAIGMLSIADDDGYFHAEPGLIRSALWPFDEDSTKARRVLARLVEIGWIEIRHHPTRGAIGRVVNFKKHQRIDRPSASRIACYFLDEHSTNIPRTIAEDSTLEQGTGNRDQGSGNREQGAGKRARAAATTTDEEWIEGLKADPTYRGIDIDIELGKCRRWCEANSQQPTRRRFINWLNRARPITANGSSQGNHRTHHSQSLRNSIISGSDEWDQQAAEALARAESGMEAEGF